MHVPREGSAGNDRSQGSTSTVVLRSRRDGEGSEGSGGVAESVTNAAGRPLSTKPVRWVDHLPNVTKVACRAASQLWEGEGGGAVAAAAVPDVLPLKGLRYSGLDGGELDGGRAGGRALV